MKPKYDPADSTEVCLMKHENLAEGIRRDDSYYGASTECDICRHSFSNRRFMIDGNRKSRGVEWACMCSSCFLKEGE